MKKSTYLGKTIKIINMIGEPDYANKQGVVVHVDGINQLHGTWGRLAVIPGIDKFEILEDKKNETF